MDNKDLLKDLRDIRTMMERSSRFQVVSGWGILAAGIMALVAVWVANSIFSGCDSTLYGNTGYIWAHKTQIAVSGTLVLLVVCGLTILFSSMLMARRRNIPFAFDATMRRLLVAFSVPLAAGGVLCLALVLQGHYGLTSSIMLIFYGLALMPAIISPILHSDCWAMPSCCWDWPTVSLSPMRWYSGRWGSACCMCCSVFI